MLTKDDVQEDGGTLPTTKFPPSHTHTHDTEPDTEPTPILPEPVAVRSYVSLAERKRLAEEAKAAGKTHTYILEHILEHIYIHTTTQAY